VALAFLKMAILWIPYRGGWQPIMQTCIFRLAQKQVTPQEERYFFSYNQQQLQGFLNPQFLYKHLVTGRRWRKPAIFGRVVSSKGHIEGRYSIPTVTVQVI